MKIIVIGGGWAGVSAAIAARRAGMDVTIIEKTDLLLGAGNVGGIMRNNGRHTAAEEMIALGAGDAFEILDSIALHRNVDFPGHSHATLYPVSTAEAHIRRHLLSLGITLKMESRVCAVDFADWKIRAVRLESSERVEGDVFVEATGTAGPMGNCLKYGNGCCMCAFRCPSYGPRMSVSAACGAEDYRGERADDVFGVFSGSCKLDKASLSGEVRKLLDENGVAILKISAEDVDYGKLSAKACKQYALNEFSENIILLDTGHAKLMTSYYPLEKLRKIEGLENAKYIDPYAGGRGNSVRFLSIAPRSNAMTVDDVKNLFCAGEKSGLFVGHTEAIATGALAGHNAARMARGAGLLVLPESLSVGDIISYANHKVKNEGDRKSRLTFSGGEYFTRMKDKKLYLLSPEEIKEKVSRLGLAGVFSTAL